MRNGKTEILDSQTICKQTDRYIGWPTVGVLPGCELIAVFSGDRDAHADPFGKSFLIRSADKGTTWSTPVLINDTPLDDRDTGLCVCRDGTVVMTWFTSHYDKKSYLDMAPAGLAERWTEKIDSVTMEDIKNWANEKIEEGRYELGKWIRSSADGGHTWSEPVRVPVTTPHGPVELSDGRLMFLGIDGIYGRRRKENSIVAVESPDRGRTWTILGKVNMYPPY